MRFEQQFMTHDGRGPHENDPEWPTDVLSLLDGVDPIDESRGLCFDPEYRVIYPAFPAEGTSSGSRESLSFPESIAAGPAGAGRNDQLAALDGNAFFDVRQMVVNVFLRYAHYL